MTETGFPRRTPLRSSVNRGKGSFFRGYTSGGGRIRTFAERKGCLVGWAAVLGLVLLYLLYLFAAISIPLLLGFLFPWDPPRAEGAPDEAVLRVLAPEEEEYRIEWGSGFWTDTDEGEKVDPELGYRDYPLREEALDSNRHIQIKIYAGNKAAHPTGNPEVPLGAVLFVSGEYAECRGGRSYLRQLDSWPQRFGLHDDAYGLRKLSVRASLATIYGILHHYLERG